MSIKTYSIVSAAQSIPSAAVNCVIDNDYNQIVWADGAEPILEADLDAAGATIELNAAKEKKKKEINDRRDAIVSEPVFQTAGEQGKHFDVDILGWHNYALSMAEAETIDWICTDNTIVALGKPEIISLCCHIKARSAIIALLVRQAKDAVIALTTIADVEAYTVNIG